MTQRTALRVHFDGTAFMRHRRSGISRYFAELIAAYDGDPALGVLPVTPYRYMTNVHARSTSRGFHSLPLPRRVRGPVLDQLNRRTAGSAVADVEHFPLYDAAVLDAARRAVRSVTTVYDFTFEIYPELFGDLTTELTLKRQFLEACSVLVCISEATRQDLLRFHPDLDKPVVVTPLAVAQEFFAAGDRPLRGLPERYVLHVGNRAQHKNMELLFRAFKELSTQDPDLHLVMSGAGLPDEPDRLAELGITERTHLLKVSDRQLPALYRHARAFILPSRYEGFGLPLLEAMAAGCPAVISNTPALLEVAGGSADVVDMDDVEGAVLAIQRLVADSGHAEARRSEGRRRAMDFSWHRTAELTAAAYDLAVRPR